MGAVRVAAEASIAILYTVVLVPLAVRVAFLGRLLVVIVEATIDLIVTWWALAGLHVPVAATTNAIIIRSAICVAADVHVTTQY